MKAALRRAADRSRASSDDTGAVAAEVAITLPAVVLVLALGVGALSAASRQVRLDDAAADAARLVARGEGDDSARAVVARAVPGATAEVAQRDELACVTASVRARVVVSIPLEATSCALAGGR